MTARHTRILMTASAAAMGAAGLAGLFLPEEILGALGAPAAGVVVAIVQLLAAVWLASAMTNWMSRGNAIGGIYNRPIAIGNVAHFAIGAITLGKLVAGGGASLALVAAAIVYSVFAIAFGMVMLGDPTS